MQEIFFELLRVSVGQMDCLSRGLSVQEWNDIYHTAQRHGLVGVCYKGVERLFDYGLRAPQDLSIDWMADAEALREEQELFEKRCQKLVAKLSERKLRASVMEGLGMRIGADSELQHLLKATSIDVFLDCSPDRVIKFATQAGQQEIRCGYTSLALNVWRDTPVNLHYRVLSSRNSFVNSRMQKWFAQNKELMFKGQNPGGLSVPSPAMNAVCMLQTLQQRLLSGKATMSCLVDYYYVLTQLNGDFPPFKDGTIMATILETLGLARFAAGVMWVLGKVLAMNRQCMVCEPAEEEGRFILAELMAEKYSYGRLLLHYPSEMLWPKR